MPGYGGYRDFPSDVIQNEDAVNPPMEPSQIDWRMLHSLGIPIGETDNIPGTSVPRTNPVASPVVSPAASPAPAVPPGSPLGRVLNWEEPGYPTRQIPIQQMGAMRGIRQPGTTGAAPNMENPPEGTAAWIPATQEQSMARVASGEIPRLDRATQGAADDARMVNQDAARERQRIEAYRAEGAKRRTDEQTRFAELSAVMKGQIGAAAEDTKAYWDPARQAQGRAALAKLAPEYQKIIEAARGAKPTPVGYGSDLADPYTGEMILSNERIGTGMGTRDRTPFNPADAIYRANLEKYLAAGLPVDQAQSRALKDAQDARAGFTTATTTAQVVAGNSPEARNLKGGTAREVATQSGIGATQAALTPVDASGRPVAEGKPAAQVVQEAKNLGTLPPASERQRLAELFNVDDMLNRVRTLTKDFQSGWFGPVRGGVLAPFNERVTGNISDEEVQARRLLKDSADMLLRARSGAQINEQEYKRLASLLPSPELPENVAKARMDDFQLTLRQLIAEKVKMQRTSAGQLGEAAPPASPAAQGGGAPPPLTDKQRKQVEATPPGSLTKFGGKGWTREQLLGVGQ